VNAKDKKSEVFSYFEKGKGEVFAKSHTTRISSNKRLNTSRRLC